VVSEQRGGTAEGVAGRELQRDLQGRGAGHDVLARLCVTGFVDEVSVEVCGNELATEVCSNFA
jgi:hypothetical protein